MAQPTAAQLLALDFDYMGEPFCPVGSAGVAGSLDWVYGGEPFYFAQNIPVEALQAQIWVHA